VSRRGRDLLFVIAGLTLATAAMQWRLVASASHAIPLERRDPLLNAWILAWDADRFRHGLRGLWEMPILYPFHDTLAFTEHLLGVALFAAPIEWATGNPILSYNAIFFASFIFAGAAMFAFARALTGRADAAVVAAAIFAFYPYHVAQAGHLQTMMTGWMPLALLGLHRYFDTGSRPPLAGAAIAYWFEAMSNGYYLFFFGFAIVAVCVWGMWRTPGERRVRRLGDLTMAAVAVGALYAPIAIKYFDVRQRYELVRPADDIVRFGADVGSYLTMSPAVAEHLHVELPHFPKPSGSEEQHDGMLFPGFAMVVLAVIGTLSARRDVAALYLSIASIGFVLSLGPEPTVWGHTITTVGPYAWLLEAAPILDSLRVPARLAILVYLGLSVLASFGAAALVAGRSARARSIVCSLLVAFVVFEGYGAVPMVEIGRRGRTRDNGLYAWLARQPARAVLELPIARLDNDYRGFIYQYNTLVHGHPLVNGWTGYSTDLQQWLGDAASPLRNSALAGDGLDLLRGLGVGYVIVHPDDFDPRENAPPVVQGILDARSKWTDVRQFGSVYAFTLAPSAPIEPVPPLDTIDPATIHVSASHANGGIANLFDGNPATRWTTGEAQEGSEWLELAFDREREVRRVRFVLHPRDFRDYPRGLEIDAIDGAVRTPLFRGSVMTAFGRGLALDPMRPSVDIVLPPQAARALRVAQTGSSSGWWWSIDELSLYTDRARSGRP
jgi:hypothetical protein